jgi:hypothetical protein
MSTLKVDTILKRTGTGTITLGQSGDTISVPTGASLSLQGGTNGQALTTNGSGTLSFATVGEDNSPYFLVNGSGTQTISNSADTVLAFNQVISSMDSASGYNTSNYRYTVQTGGAGLWYVRAGIYFSSASSFGNGEQVQMQLRVNGGAQLNNHMFYMNNTDGWLYTHGMLKVAEGDYFDTIIWQNTGGNITANLTNGNNSGMRGFRIKANV